jgi:Fur family ferric uptake transcriptional regulator
MSSREMDYAMEHRREAAAISARTDAAAVAVVDLRSAVALMRERGLRVSAARRLVLEALLVADGPMSAEQIAQGIGGRVPSSDLASVYRNLQAFEEIGLVRHVHLGHGPGLHVLAVAGEREYLTCERCGDFRAVSPEQFDVVRELIERSFGYRASFTHFPIVGLCPGCAEAVGGPPPWCSERP